NPESRDSRSGPTDHPGMTAGLTPPRRDTAIDREDHAGSVAGTVGGEERHQVADLPRMRGTGERQALLEFLVAVLVAELVFCAGLQERHVAVGADRSGIDADDANVVGKTLSAERAGKSHQRGVAGAA